MQRCELAMALASWKAALKVLEEKKGAPSNHLLKKGLFNLVKPYKAELEVEKAPAEEPTATEHGAEDVGADKSREQACPRAAPNHEKYTIGFLEVLVYFAESPGQ